MKKPRHSVLIVEDDITQGNALAEAFKRCGYTVVLTTSSANAITTSHRTEFHAFIVDCMLPKMNGVDLLEEILATLPRRPKVFLISGIFKDKPFIKEATDRVQADGFFTKPVDLEVLVQEVKKSLDGDHSHSEETPFPLRLYTSEPLTGIDLKLLLQQESVLHGFHLPKLLQRIVQTDISGELGIISEHGSVSEIRFYHGQIFDVRTADRESYFGSLAVSLGYVAPEEVLEALNDTVDKRLGQKLIDSMSLSPHAIQVVLEEQLALRLSQAVQEGVMSLSWSSKRYATPDYALSEKRLTHLAGEWFESKLTSDWMQNAMTNPNFKLERDSDRLFRSLLKGEAHISGRGNHGPDFTFLESRLNKMTADFERLNYFQFLGVGEKSHSRELGQAYDDLSESFNPDSQPANCPPELKEKCAKVFAMIETAYKTLSDDVERLRYQQQLNNRRSQELLMAEPVFRAAVLELQSGHPRQAAKKFDDLAARKMDFKDLRSYRLWAGLKLDRNFSDIRIDQIPPEERHSTAFLMAKGIAYRTKGNYKLALEAFRTALVFDPRMSIARFELQSLVNEMEKSKGNRDILKEAAGLLDTILEKISRRSG
jgi:CheY-like chemotaxis protein/curved DNA-binding protein CbpA